MCNLKCPCCFQEKKEKNDAMTTQEWIRLADELPLYARVTLTGGEPLIFKGFDEVFAHVASRYECNVITNGLLLSEERIRGMLSYPNFKILGISIDDIGNRLRGFSSSQWNYLCRMIRYFLKVRQQKGSRCLLDIKTVILDENAEQLFDFYRYCAQELRCDNHSLQFLKGSRLQHADRAFRLEEIFQKTRANVYEKFHIISQQLNLIREDCQRTARNVFLHPKIEDMKSQQPWKRLFLMNERNYLKQWFQPCRFPWSSVHINADGHVFPCISVSMGNVRTKSLRAIIRGEQFRQFRSILRLEKTVEACHRCGWLRPALRKEARE